jgi:hypothetical protein
MGSGDMVYGEGDADLFFTGTWVDPDNAPVIFDLEEDEVVIVSVPAGTSPDTVITLETDETSGDTIVQANGQTVVIIDASAGPMTVDRFLVVDSINIVQPPADVAA